MTYIPNSDKPTDAQEIEGEILELLSYKRGEHWDLVKVATWLNTSPIKILHAAKRIDDCFEEIYPGKEI